ncbi:MAG: YgdI/YgdR family lipoprotein [Verrucomicrobiota bacterium]
MKNLFMLLTAFTLVGCKTSYDVTLSDGKKITGVSKPVLDKTKDQYQFKMADGREVKIYAGRIRTIAPHGESSEPKFVSPTDKK